MLSFIELLQTKLTLFAAACDGGNFLGFPTWYKYLEQREFRGTCSPHLEGINDVWLIGLAVIEILLRIAMIAAIAFVVYGGIKYAASRGNSDKVESAQRTLTDAVIGLIIAIVATAVVGFLARFISRGN